MSFAKGFSEEVKRDVYEAQNGYCCVEGCTEKITDFHHAVHNTKYNRKRFPLFLGSPFNCKGCCRYHHDNYTQYAELNISDDMAYMFERWLTNLMTGG